MSKKRISERQLAANRANATHSTGPKTPEGKTRSSQNARKHGFASARFTVIRLEDVDSLAALRVDAIAAYQPANSQEFFAVERIALAQHHILRAAALEAGLFTLAMNESVMPDGVQTNLVSDDLARGFPVERLQNRSLAAAEGFERCVRKADAFRLFLRYQAQCERLYRRAVDEFKRLRADRDQFPNEPIDTAESAPEPIAELLLPPGPLSQDDLNARWAAQFDPTLAVPFHVHHKPEQFLAPPALPEPPSAREK